MLCQNCQQRNANVHITKVINNKRVDLYLCDHCATGDSNVNFGTNLSLSDFLPGLLGFGPTPSQVVAVQPQQLVCDNCGLTFEEFQKIGKFGCSTCYEVFNKKIEPLIKRLHGNASHHGKFPIQIAEQIELSKEIQNLKDELNKAIKNEEYEKAAELRDAIRQLESEKR